MIGLNMSGSYFYRAVMIAGVLLGLLSLLRLYLRRTLAIFEGKERLDGKTVIVTGGSSGIGKESARNFARRGARVVMTCRDMAKGEKVMQNIIQETGNNNLILKRLDFTDLASVRSCAKEILEEVDRIDILLNNAGATGMGDKITDDGMQILMQSNHFGPFLFTNILLEKIRISTPARIVNVSSLAHKFACLDLDNLDQSNVSNNMKVYANSKLANVYFTIELADKLRGQGVTVNSLHPGAALTEIMRYGSSYVQTASSYIFHYFVKLNSVNPAAIKLKIMKYVSSGAASKIFGYFAKSSSLNFEAVKIGIMKYASSFVQTTTSYIFNYFLQPAEEGAQTQIMLCVSKDLEHVTGEYFSDCKKVELSPISKDKERAAKLWELSEIAVKLQDDEIHYN